MAGKARPCRVKELGINHRQRGQAAPAGEKFVVEQAAFAASKTESRAVCQQRVIVICRAVPSIADGTVTTSRLFSHFNAGGGGMMVGTGTDPVMSSDE